MNEKKYVYLKVCRICTFLFKKLSDFFDCTWILKQSYHTIIP